MPIPWRFAAALVAALACPAAPAADLLPFKATETTLPNGLKLIVVPTGLPNLVSLQIPVKVGARNEVEPGRSGFAHFFEHMMFRGTKAYPPERASAILQRAGVNQNAYTNDDLSNYYSTFAKDDLETILKLEADRFQNLSYSEDAFKTESRAVLGEYNKNSANPVSRLYDDQRNAAFSRHPYKHTPIGFLADIEDMPNQYAYSKQFFDRWYRPEHTTLIVAGDVQPAQVLQLVKRYWGGWKRGHHRANVPAEPPPAGPVYSHVPWSSPTLPWVAVSFRAPRFSTEAKDAAALATLLELSFGPASPLYRRLVQDEQRVDDLSLYVPQRVDPGLASIFARVKKAEDVQAVRDALLQTAARLRTEVVSPRALSDAQSAGRYGLLRSLDTTEQIAETLATFVHFDRSYGTLNRYHRLLGTLTPEDLRSAAARYLVDEGLVVGTLSHEALPPAVAVLPRLDSLLPRAAADTRLDLLVMPSSLPQMRLRLVFDAGSAHDPQGKEGLAALTAAMVAEAGSRQRKADEVKQALFPLAASFDAQVDKEMTSFNGAVHPERWSEFLDIALPLLLSPGFREEDFQRLKENQLNALRVNLKGSNEEEFAKERLQANVYAGTPYGHPVSGTEASIAALTLDDVKDFHRRAYTRAALHAGLSGAVTEPMAGALRQALAALPPGPGLAATPVPAGRMPQGLEVEILQKDTRATAISFGFPLAVTRAHPDFVALTVARSWLGEHRNSSAHVYQRIRETRGLNYGDYAYIEAFPRGMFLDLPEANVARKAQLFEVWLRPVRDVESAHFALRVAVTELDKLVEQGMTEAQFASSRDFLMKYVFLMTSTLDRQLGYALDSRWYGTPEFTQAMRDGLSKLTVADVNAAVRRHLSARNLSVVVVTQDAADLKARLLADTPSAIGYDGDKPAELLAEDRVIGARKLGVRSVTVTPAAQAFAR